MQTSAQSFIKAVELKLKPIMRELGFSGRGRNWNRVREPFIDCVRLQILSDNTACCVSLGEHLTFLPIIGKREPIDPKRVSADDCEIAFRMTPGEEVDFWWQFSDGDSAQSYLLSTMSAQLEKSFAIYSDFPRPFEEISESNICSEKSERILASMTHIRKALLLARVSEHVGDKHRAKSWARYGLEQDGRASAVKIQLRELLNRVSK
ncbi:DUF4304 domain-containing protein [Stratiformator vulcanicus]|uniref:DUF4304 domain-containing protein n=1 Tax=Stratiformator vulcanicus TaxID=2527980 RepID=A0A517R5S2_9PLAN|nr:DUF4304 domain-containing protein [Stratiformator vulcanicus]QDT39256.1 hypothetical protein Pan189_36600 [Stratiformator vulcanicus]